MSGEIGVVMLAPAVIPVALFAAGVGATGYAIGKLADVAIERERRVRDATVRVARATDRYRAVRDQVERARQQFGAEIDPMPDAPPDLSPGGDLARADAIAAEIGARVDAAQQRLQVQLGIARSKKIMAAVRRAVAEIAASAPAQAAPPAIVQRPAELEESLRRVLSRLDPAGSEADTRQLEEWAAQALKAPTPATALRLLDDLRHEVDTVNRTVERRRARLADLADRLREHTGPLIDAALALLATAGDAPEWDTLETAVADAIAHTREAALRDYTAWALRDSLREIGIESEEDFDVLLAQDGMAHVRRPGWEDVAVRVRHRPADDAVHFNLVAPRGDGAAPDPAAEEQWCRAFDALVPALAERGIEVRVTHRSEEGEAQVQQVDESRFPFERRRRDRRTDERRREMGR
jgi:hypothetical protein